MTNQAALADEYAALAAEVEAEFGTSAPRPSKAPESRSAPARAKAKSRVIAPTPYVCDDPAKIPSRQYEMKPYYIRRYVTGTLAHGAVGKSILVMTEACALASGKALLGVQPRGRFRTWYWNGEDGREELNRRFAAIRKHYDLHPADLADHLFVDSGRDLPITIVALDRDTRMAMPVEVDLIAEALLASRIDTLIIDPFVSSHRVPENQNEMIEVVAQAWNDVAERANAAVHLSHHAVKSQGRAVTGMDYRGGGAALAKLRALRVLNTMTVEEAKDAVPDDQRWRYFRADEDKPNLVPPDTALWYRKASVDLGNADIQRDGMEYAEPDVLGVPEPWEYPQAPDLQPTVDHMRRVHDLMGSEPWAKTSNSKRWIGDPIAQALGADRSKKPHRDAIGSLIKDWEASGVLRLKEYTDSNRNKREGYIPGEIPDEG